MPDTSKIAGWLAATGSSGRFRISSYPTVAALEFSRSNLHFCHAIFSDLNVAKLTTGADEP
jgi:hypothetical protein